MEEMAVGDCGAHGMGDNNVGRTAEPCLLQPDRVIPPWAHYRGGESCTLMVRITCAQPSIADTMPLSGKPGSLQ